MFIHNYKGYEVFYFDNFVAYKSGRLAFIAESDEELHNLIDDS